MFTKTSLARKIHFQTIGITVLYAVAATGAIYYVRLNIYSQKAAATKHIVEIADGGNPVKMNAGELAKLAPDGSRRWSAASRCRWGETRLSRSTIH